MTSRHPEAEAVAEQFRQATQKHLPAELEARKQVGAYGETFDAWVDAPILPKDIREVGERRELEVDRLLGDDDALELWAGLLAQDALEEWERLRAAGSASNP